MPHTNTKRHLGPDYSYSCFYRYCRDVGNSELLTAAYSGDLILLNRILPMENKKLLGSPLTLACLYNKFEAVKILVAAGANVNFAGAAGLMGLTPLHAACMNGSYEMVRFLLERGASLTALTNVSETQCTISDKPPSDNNLLHCACSGSYADKVGLVKELLLLGVDPNKKNEYGYTPLHYAVLLPSLPKKVELLLKGGAAVNAIDKHGSQPIHYARGARTLGTLYEFGADIDAFNATGRTSLYYQECTHTLLALGGGSHVKCRSADCDCATTVLMCAYQNYRETAVEKRARYSRRPRRSGYGSLIWNVLWDIEDFEKFFILTAVAGISLGEENKPANPPLDNIDWTIEQRRNFEKECNAEFANMDVTIPGTLATYKGVMLQHQPSALKNSKLKKILTLAHCTKRYPLYGELVYCGFLLGQRKLPLIGQCFRFFTNTLGYQKFPKRCMENILCRLREKDLQNLIAACGTSEN